MNVLEKGRDASLMSMILFFIMGTMGFVMNYGLAVYTGFILAIISVPSAILMTLKLQGKKE